MKYLVVFAAILAFALADRHRRVKIDTLKHAISRMKHSTRIINGEAAIVGQFPWQVSVEFIHPNGMVNNCGGSLISDQWVLTAAHCVEKAKTVILRLGGISLNKTEEGRVDVTTTTFFVHEGYNSNMNNDVAVIKMDAPIAFNNRIKSIGLSKRGDRVGVGERLVVSGWGYTYDGSYTPSNHLNFVGLDSISNDDCADLYGDEVVIESTLCCKGRPNHSTCNCDSGGPLVVVRDNKYVQAGVVSFVAGLGCEKGYPSAFQRTESFLDWISEKTGLPL